jgi:hypothetical protein
MNGENGEGGSIGIVAAAAATAIGPKRARGGSGTFNDKFFTYFYLEKENMDTMQVGAGGIKFVSVTILIVFSAVLRLESLLF